MMQDISPAYAVRTSERWLLCVLVALGLGGFSLESFASDIRCQCGFAAPPWKAVGTRAACTAVTSNGRTSCNIAFGGTGADPRVVQDVLKVAPGEYNRKATDLLITYLRFVNENPKGLSNAKFIREALPSFMRGAYLRPGVTARLGDLDAVVIAFAERYAGQVAEIMASDKEAVFEVEAAKFTVTGGAITVDFDDIRIVTIFLPGPVPLP